jgi:hypothetical protein
MVTIEAGIPLPERAKYPFRDMEVGDSMFFEDENQGASARVASLRFVKAHQPDWKFTLRRAEDKPGWRLWRVEP